MYKLFAAGLALLIVSAGAFAGGESDGDTASSSTMTAVSSGEYSEAPMLAAMVAAGELPPVAERLPVEPPVMEPIDSVGTYGDTIYVFVASTEPWNTLQEETERGSYLAYIRADTSVVPNLAKSFDLADDFLSLTITLREGAQWSDGHPFTADDIVFAYEDWHFDSRVGSGTQAFWMNKVRRAIKIDDYNVRLETDVPYPVMLAKMGEPAGGDWHSYLPKHYLEKFHIKYNPDADALAKELGYDSWSLAFNAHDWEYQNGFRHLIDDNEPRPTMQPWKLIEVTDTTKVHERNPYFYKVDELGQQLPYIDRIIAGIADVETIQLKIIAGEVDYDFVNATSDNYALYKENEAAGGYDLREVPVNQIPIAFAFNQTHEEKGHIFRDLRFRQAMSLAINAEEVLDSVYFGLGEPMVFPVAGATFSPPEWSNNPMDAYDVDEANRLLDAVGLDQRDGDGWRLGEDGKPFTITMEGRVQGEHSATNKSIELVREYWRAVGLQTEIKLSDNALHGQRRDGNLIEVNFGTWGFPSEARQYMIDREGWVHGAHDLHWAPLWGDWLMAWIQVEEGTRSISDYEGGVLPGEEPPEEFKELFQWGEDLQQTVLGSPEYLEVTRKIYGYHFDNLLMQGIVGGQPLLVVAKSNLVNVPKGYFGSAAWWGDLNIEAEQLYFK
jgi:peptide/nickel transport system substrate-binding protein